MSVNFALGDFVSQWRVATSRYLKYAIFKVEASVVIPILEILYINGVIKSFRILTLGRVLIYFKYSKNILSRYYLIIYDSLSNSMNVT